MKNYLFITLWLLAVSCQAQYSWVNKDSFPAGARDQSVGFSIGDTGYLVGGWTHYPNAWVNEVWSYNATSDTWTQKDSFPGGATDGMPLVIGNSAFLIGGYIGGGTYSSTNFSYNPASDTWTAKSSFPEGPVGGAFHFSINGIGYIGEGKRSGANTSYTVYSYNASSDSWTSVADFPESLVDPTGFAIDTLGYAGLGTDGSGHLSSNFYKYSPTANTWTPIAAFPGVARGAAACFVINGIAYVGGGYSYVPGSANAAYDLGDFYSYNPSTDTWTAVPGLPGRGRNSSSAFSINNNGYVVVGWEDITSLPVSNVAEFGTCSEVTGIIPVPANNTKSGLEIYPNPSTYDVNVKIDANVIGQINYQVVSVDGKTVRLGSTQQSLFTFNAGNLSNGVYLLTITDNAGTRSTERFEVIH